MVLNVVDVASHQTVQQAITAGADACIVKATQGTGYINPKCDAQYQLAKQHGLLLGVYHYAGGGSPISEADYFLANIKGYIGEAILILDWEEYQNASYNNTNWARQFVNRVHEKTGVWCVLYGNRQDIDRCLNLVNDCALWFAGYPTNTQRDWNAPEFIYNISPWKSMIGWQYSAADVDRSKFYITKEQWNKYANPSQTNKPNPAPQPVKPNKTVDPTTAGQHFPIMQDPKFPQNKAHLDRFGPVGNKLVVEGWHTTVSNHEFIIIMDRVKNKELARKEVKPIARPDVKKAFGLSVDQVGFKTEFDLAQFKGHSVIVLLRATNDPKGNTAGGFQDFTETRWYHDIK